MVSVSARILVVALARRRTRATTSICADDAPPTPIRPVWATMVEAVKTVECDARCEVCKNLRYDTIRYFL